LHYIGLYYPFIHFKDDAWLKLTALYWDKMGRIVPETYKTEDTDTVKQLAERSDYIETFRPGWVGPEFGERFIRFLKTRKAKLKKRYDISKRNQWPNVPPELRPPPQGGLSGTDPKLTYVFSEKITKDAARELEESSLALPDAGDRRWIGMHPKLATVYMTALAEQLASERGLRPVTDETLDHLAVSGCTIERLGQALLGDVNLSERKLSSEEITVEMASFAFQAVLPKDIANVPIKKIIRFRKKFAAERFAFQAYLEALPSKEEWRELKSANAVRAHLKLEYTKNLQPKFDELKKQLRDVGIDTVIGAMNVRVASTPALAIGATIGLTGNPVFSILVGVGGLALGLIPVIRDKQKEIEKIYRSSPAAYLLRMEENLAPAKLRSWIGQRARQFRFGV
jgi:hypothetical protein